MNGRRNAFSKLGWVIEDTMDEWLWEDTYYRIQFWPIYSEPIEWFDLEYEVLHSGYNLVIGIVQNRIIKAS